jgi:hypothetical protein
VGCTYIAFRRTARNLTRSRFSVNAPNTFGGESVLHRGMNFSMRSPPILNSFGT